MGNQSTELTQALDIQNRITRGDLMIGIMDPIEIDRMVELFKTAGENGEPAAYFQLGIAYRSGILHAPQPKLAVESFQLADDAGYGPDAKLEMVRTAYFYDKEALTNDTVVSTLDELVETSPDPEVRVLRGYCKLVGYGFESDPVAAHEEFIRAAEAGSGDAMFELYIFYAQGIGVEPNADTSNKWLKLAADGGNHRAMFNLGGMYATGNGVAPDQTQSLHWYEQAAIHGNGRAASTLAYMFFTGNDAPQDKERAHEFYDMAYDLGADPGELFLQLGIDPLD